MSGAGLRPYRSARVEGAAWRLFDAWRASSGLGLGYFFREDRGDDDRRVQLASGLNVSDLDDAGFRELWDGAGMLTASERRVVDREGAVWLVQGVGPVWADGRGRAAGTIGIRLRCVSADRSVVHLGGKAPGDVSEADLIEAIEAAPQEEAARTQEEPAG